MGANLKDTLFDRFYHISDKEKDTNKNINGEGTLERYNSTIGEDIDVNLYPFIDDAFSNLVLPLSMLERYIPEKERSIGNNVLFLGFSTDMRRRIIQHWNRYVSIKGTIRCYEVLFNMMGITGVVITETLNAGGFDSVTTFDSEIRPTFDSGKCSVCSSYTIELTGPPLTTTILNAIYSIILFNQPINLVLTLLTYNGVDILNIQYNWSYSTIQVGTHDPSFVNVGETMIFQLSTVVIVDNNPSFVIAGQGAKTLNVAIDDFTDIQEIDLEARGIDGALNLSNFDNVDIFQLSNNTTMTGVSHALVTNPIAIYDVSGCSSLGSYTLVTLEGLLGIDNALVDFSDCNLFGAQVDAYLAHMVNICITIRGEVFPGSFVGRVVNIDGNNLAPSAAGVASAAQLTNIGITVNTN